MRRRLMKVGLFVLIGMAINVALAWTLLIAADPTDTIKSTQPWAVGSPHGWPKPQFRRQRVSTGVRVEEQSAELAKQPAGSWMPSSEVYEAIAPGRDSVQRVWLVEQISSLQYRDLRSSTHSCGWPARCLTSSAWYDREQTGKPPPPIDASPALWWRSGIPVRIESIPPDARGAHCLPIRPLWLGFLLNWAIFAGAVGAAWHLPGFVRWSLRRECGLCPECGYPIGSAPICAECGGAVTADQATRALAESEGIAERRVMIACVAGLIALSIVYALTLRWGACYKAGGGWFAGVASGRFNLGRSSVNWVDPGWELTRYATPFGLWFQWVQSPTRWAVGVPLWVPFILLLAVAGRMWWLRAVRQARLAQLRTRS